MPRKNDKREMLMDFSRGLNTEDPPVTLPDNMMPDLMNVIPFKKTLRKRPGRANFATALPSDSLMLKDWELSTGTRGTLAQFNATANKSGGTESKSLLYYETGNGVYAPVPWFNSGTAVFAAGTSVTITPADNRTAFANMRTATDYWVRANTGADQNWYKVASVSGNVLTLDTAHPGSGGAGVSYTIVKTMPNDTQGWVPGSMKDQVYVTCSGMDPMRFDGSLGHLAGNLGPATDVTFAAAAGGSTTEGSHRVVSIYEYGILGKSAPITGSDGLPISNSVNVAGGNDNITCTATRGPQDCKSIAVCAQLADAPAGDPYYYVGRVLNSAATLTVSFNISDADLQNSEGFSDDTTSLPPRIELDTGIDVGCTMPPKGALGIIVDGRMVWQDDDNKSNLNWSKPFLVGENPALNVDPVNPEDGSFIGGFGISYGRLMVFKGKDRVYVCAENRPGTPIEQVNTDLGAVSPDIRYHNGWLYWLTRDGVARGDIRGAQIISRAITKSMRFVKQTVQRLGRFWATGQTDLSTGATLSNVQVTNGEIVLETFTHEDNTNAEWASGAATRVNMEAENTNDPDVALRSGNGAALILSHQTGSGLVQVRNIALSTIAGQASAGDNPGWTSPGNAIDGTGSTAATQTVNSTGTRTLRVRLSTSVDFWRSARVEARVRVILQTGSVTGPTMVRLLRRREDGTDETVLSATALAMGTTTTVAANHTSTLRTRWYEVEFNSFPNVGSTLTLEVFFVKAYESRYQVSGSFTSKVFDTGVTNPGMGTANLIYTNMFFDTNVAGSTASSSSTQNPSLIWEVRAGSVDDGTFTGWTGWTAQGSGQPFQAYDTTNDVFYRYFQYRLAYSHTGPNPGSVSVRVTSAKFDYYKTGTYTSTTIDTSATPNAWGAFSDDRLPSGGTIQAAVAAAAADPPTVFSDLDVGDKLPVTVNRYARVRYTLTPPQTPGTAGTTPKVRAFGFEWYFSTAPAAKYRASLCVYQDYLYVALERTQAQGTLKYNDVVYVADLTQPDEAGQVPWTRYDWRLNAMTVSAGVFYGASSDQGTGAGKAYVLLASGAYDDNGTAINAYFLTKPYGFSPGMKKWRRLWVAAREAFGANTTIRLFVNGAQSADTVSATALGYAAKFSEDKLTVGNETGDGVEPQAAGWTGTMGIPQNLAAGSADYRVSGRGHYFSIRGVHDTLNESVIEIYGFAVSYAERQPVGSF